jgi:uncharacterized protein YggL (DUF469 family)
MNNTTLEEDFSNFIFSLYGKRPNELPEKQKNDLLYAFMAGVVSTNEKFMKTTEMNESESLLLLDELQNEISSFSEKLKNQIK